MKKLLLISVIAVSFSACSTCYECSTDVPLTDATTGDTISTSANIEEFCTADGQQVEDREKDGASCRVQ